MDRRKMDNTKLLHAVFRDKGRSVKRSKGQVIQTTEGSDAVNLICEGYIKRYKIANDGSIGVEVIYGRGDIFSLTHIFRTLFQQEIYGGPEVYYYEAITNCEMLSLPIAELESAVDQNPVLFHDLMAEAGTRLQFTLQGLENLTLKTSYKRVAHLLLYLVERWGRKGVAGTKIHIPLTHQDLADILSLTRETVSVSMMKLRKKGLVKGNTNILVPDIQKLSDEAYS